MSYRVVLYKSGYLVTAMAKDDFEFWFYRVLPK